MFSIIYETGKWPKHVRGTMTALKNKPQATKYINHCTVSLMAHTAKIVMRYFEEILKRK
jgi:hypothetical protein